MPGSGYCHDSVASTYYTMQTPVLTYQPSGEHQYRITWYGGESTMLRFEKLCNRFDVDTKAPHQEWLELDVRTLGGGIPSSMKDMLMEMHEYYEYCIEMEQEHIFELM